MSFLKSLGGIFKTVPQVLSAVQPSTLLLAGMLPTGSGGKVLDIFNGTAAIVATTEAAAQAVNTAREAANSTNLVDGETKAMMAIPQVAALINVSSFMFDKKVIDPAGFQAGCKALVDATVTLMHSVQQKSLDEINAEQQSQQLAGMKLNGQVPIQPMVQPMLKQ